MVNAGNNGRESRKRGPKRPEEISRLKTEVVSYLRAGYSYTGAALEVAIERNTIKAWRDKDTEFDTQCQYAIEITVERVEAVLFQSALKSAVDPRYQTSLFFYLKSRAPHRWRDVQNVRQSDSFTEKIERMSPAELLRMAKTVGLEIKGHKPEDFDLPAAEPEHETTYRPPGDPEDNSAGSTGAHAIQPRSTN